MKKTKKAVAKINKVKKATKGEETKEVKVTKALVDESKKNAKAALIEEVISNREVKYKYPEDCKGPLDRKKFRAQARKEIEKLELKLARMKATDPGFEKLQKELTKVQHQYLKAA